ncbi:hypothetical protein MMC07_004827 [Pseudocyphellaria aurata]|nr:hypothetical protein [Pseudocyphellaria aurata]
MKPQHRMHRIEENIEPIIQLKFLMLISSDATAGYWAVRMKRGGGYKTGVVTPHSHNAYIRMGMELKRVAQTYARFGDMTSGYLRATADEPEQPTLLRDHGDAGFSIFVDDYVGAA